MFKTLLNKVRKKLTSFMQKLDSIIGETDQLDENIIIASFHEAGHAVMAYIVGWSINSIELEIENGILQRGITNYNFNDEEEQGRLYLIKRMHCLMGGPVSEAIYRNEEFLNLDLMGADGILIDNLLGVENDRELIIQQTINQTSVFLRMNQCNNVINEIANILINEGNIMNNTFIEIAERNGLPQMNLDD